MKFIELPHITDTIFVNLDHIVCIEPRGENSTKIVTSIPISKNESGKLVYYLHINWSFEKVTNKIPDDYVL